MHRLDCFDFSLLQESGAMIAHCGVSCKILKWWQRNSEQRQKEKSGHFLQKTRSESVKKLLSGKIM